MRFPGLQWANAAVSADGRRVWFGHVKRLWLYDGRVRGPFGFERVAGFGFAPDGRQLTVVRLGRPVLRLNALTGRVMS